MDAVATKIELVELRLRRIAINAARVRAPNADALLPPPDMLVSWADDLAESAAALDEHLPSWRELSEVRQQEADNRQRARGKLRRAGERGPGLCDQEARQAPA